MVFTYRNFSSNFQKFPSTPRLPSWAPHDPAVSSPPCRPHALCTVDHELRLAGGVVSAEIPPSADTDSHHPLLLFPSVTIFPVAPQRASLSPPVTQSPVSRTPPLSYLFLTLTIQAPKWRGRRLFSLCGSPGSAQVSTGQH